jgi:hypothetical protein
MTINTCISIWIAKSACTRAASFALLAAVTLAGCGGGTGATADPPLAPMPWSLHGVTEAGLTSYLREALGPSSKNFVNGSWAPDILVPTTAPGAAAAVFSGTTLQEAGVDEADLIKSNGTDVFSLDPGTAKGFTRDVLRRQRINSQGKDPLLVSVDSFKVPFSDDVRGTGMYLDAERGQIAVIAEPMHGKHQVALDAERGQIAVIAEGARAWGVFDAWFAPQSWSEGVTEIALVDTSSPLQMKMRRSLRVTAQLIGSRRVGSTLYLVMRSYPQMPGLDPSWPTVKTASNQAVLDTLQAAQLLPTLSIDGGAPQTLVQASSCFVQENNSVKSADIITLVGIDLAATTHRHAARCFTGGTEAFYLSDQSLYLATTRTAYTYGGAFPVYAVQSSTDIHKFLLDGLDIAYRGSGNVIGHLGFDQNRKSFRMGEHKGALRVITQTAPAWGGWVTPLAVATLTTPRTLSTVATAPMESPGHLSILQESAGALVLVGELPNTRRPDALGKPGEQLYASRFVGARGYLVTYRLTDPLYVIDLANPADPQVAGQLQVSGYSDYLFPLTETLLLGVGKDAVSDGSSGDGRFAWYQGVKLALIDVSNPAQMREVARSIIGRRGTDATVLRDHHGIALQTVGNVVRVSLPVSLHDTTPSFSTGGASDYFQFTSTQLQKFEIDLPTQSLSARAPLLSVVKGERDVGADRSLLWNNQVHYYQDGVWGSAPW